MRNCEAAYRFPFFSATVRWSTRQYRAHTHALPGVFAHALRTARSRNPISAQRSIGAGQAVRYPAGREQGPGHAQRRRTYFKRTRSPQSEF